MRKTFIFLYLLIQIAVPTILLFFPDRPTRFGWQMFSGSRLPFFSRLFTDGRRVPVSLQEVQLVVGVVRSELDYERYVPPILCKREPFAGAILSEHGPRVRRWPCR
ncbi:MAG TPA: hypothetical protein VJM31_02620 [Vicinamibacterales bacterium]|nr:hypothetical protein [Vicinamibacterales bacterium]